jgi:hypothetical protein
MKVKEVKDIPKEWKTISARKNVTYPDYISIGPKGELYANTKEFVEQNMTIID